MSVAITHTLNTPSQHLLSQHTLYQVDELYYSRRMAAIKRVEDRLAREQMNHRFVQRRAAEAALKQMVIDDLEGFEEDLNVYASSEDPDINKIIKSARAMLQVALSSPCSIPPWFLSIFLYCIYLFSHVSIASLYVPSTVLQNFMDCRVRFVDVLRRQVLDLSTHHINTSYRYILSTYLINTLS